MTTPPTISDHDYEAIAEAVMETERGRWFLAEYSRRNRAADTALVMDAIGQLERRLVAVSVGSGEAFPDLIRNIAARAAMLREELETGPAETRSARALRHLDRLEHLVSLAAPKPETPLAIAAPRISPPKARTEPIAGRSSPEPAPEPAQAPASLEAPAAGPEPLVDPEPPKAEPPVAPHPPAIVLEETAPSQVVVVAPTTKKSPPKPAEVLRAIREEARERRANPQADPAESPKPATSGGDLLGSLSPTEKAMLFA